VNQSTNAYFEHLEFEGFEGVRIAGDAYGDPEAWPVLFLHGGGQTRHAWGTSARRVAERGWRAISVDLRGHGDSGWAANGDYSFTAYCADCISVADQIGKPPVLVGASLGGIAAALAEGLSDRVVSSGLILVDIAPITNPEGIQRIREFMQSGIDGFDSLDEAAIRIAAYTPHRVREVNLEGLKKVLREKSNRWYWHWDPQVISQGRTEVVAREHSRLLDVAMNNISVPVLMVRGLLSDVVTQESVDDLLKKIPDAEVVNVEGAAHMIAGDQNSIFSDAVITFLERRIRPTVSSPETK
jgi:pimeloyl-ACP methyl ester carboxylesterase